jgi:hypothetical protein
VIRYDGRSPDSLDETLENIKKNFKNDLEYLKKHRARVAFWFMLFCLELALHPPSRGTRADRILL